MKRELFDSLDDDSLGQACFKPIIEAYKIEQTLGNDSKVYEKLTAGQQALFMFRVYFNHVRKSLADFHWWNSYFMAKPERWLGIKEGLCYFGDRDMLHLLERIEGALQCADNLSDFDVTYRNNIEDDAELAFSLKPLQDAFHKMIPITVQRIGEYIRHHQNEFVCMEE
ncbi:hypothetical protein [Bacillus sp. 165]|uniref:hypothetical protein n=1 Tax=Bacillus sp. 165 TaxID=1529117 RepID=UPI001AD95DC5|nr:hypothetical protein [Bacillus sp. 165]MBO9130729.1 hypothetical protein [Bacillus sp. 165]